jgi:hypothetical protein
MKCRPPPERWRAAVELYARPAQSRLDSNSDLSDHDRHEPRDVAPRPVVRLRAASRDPRAALRREHERRRRSRVPRGVATRRSPRRLARRRRRRHPRRRANAARRSRRDAGPARSRRRRRLAGGERAAVDGHDAAARLCALRGALGGGAGGRLHRVRAHDDAGAPVRSQSAAGRLRQLPRRRGEWLRGRRSARGLPGAEAAGDAVVPRRLHRAAARRRRRGRSAFRRVRAGAADHVPRHAQRSSLLDARCLRTVPAERTDRDGQRGRVERAGGVRGPVRDRRAGGHDVGGAVVSQRQPAVLRGVGFELRGELRLPRRRDGDAGNRLGERRRRQHRSRLPARRHARRSDRHRRVRARARLPVRRRRRLGRRRHRRRTSRVPRRATRCASPPTGARGPTPTAAGSARSRVPSLCRSEIEREAADFTS